ncbi:MAG: 50S ribosomal protein L19e [Candidatus Woesearchaeota archaeon]
MMLTVQRRLAAEVLNCSSKDVVFEEGRLSEIKEAITRQDIKALVNKGYILRSRKSEASRARARFTHSQKVKGSRKGQGSRKGTGNARDNSKELWMNRVRAQRILLKDLREREIISKDTYNQLYSKVKGGFFRNRRHIKLYLGERDLIQRKE